MPKMVMTGDYVSIDSNDLSDHTSKCELVVEIEDKDVTTYKSLGWREYLGGLASGQMAVTFKNDYAAANVDSIMWALFIGRTPVPFEVRPTQAAASPSNPKYTGSVLVKSWKPIAGSVGDVAEVDVTWPTSGAVTRATS